MAKKGRFFVATGKARRLLGWPACKKGIHKDWNLIGWIKASPRQRLAVLKAMDSTKQVSEDIRERASRSNQHLTRISVKGVLKQLIEKGLVDTELTEGKRFYWITEKGRLTVNSLDQLFADSN
jgi:predicted transcriptional regulator